MENFSVGLLIALIGGTLMVFLAVNFSKMVKTYAEQLRQKSDSDKVDKYITIAEKTVLDVVRGLNQSVVNDLKAASADGKLTKEERKSIRDQAIKQTINILSKEVSNTLMVVYGDLPEWVKIQVERAVALDKKNSI